MNMMSGDERKALVGRLLLIAAWRKPGGPTPTEELPDIHKVSNEAADRIEALSAENERLRFVGKLLCNFAGHDDDCRSHKLMGCNCGYTDAWKKWRAALGETK